MSRKKMMAGNWKMNKTVAEAVVLTQDISNQYDERWEEIDVVLCPPFVDLKPAKTVLEFDRVSIKVGAQNVHWEAEGAFTGEISVPMLKEIGCEFCIVGHSERRSLFEETDEMVNKKVKALLAAEITPIVCVGESLAVREAGDTENFVCAQLKAACAGLDASQVSKFVIAYEPIWAIGTGRSATPEQAQEVCAALRTALAREYGEECASVTRILYGGSMKPENVDALLAQQDIDGGLIGGAALQAASFRQLIEACL